MRGDPIICIVVGIGIGLCANTAAMATEVPGMSCSQIASFARQVAEQRAEGIPRNDALNRLRQSSALNIPTLTASWRRSSKLSTECQSSPLRPLRRLAPPIRPLVSWVSKLIARRAVRLRPDCGFPVPTLTSQPWQLGRTGTFLVILPKSFVSRKNFVPVGFAGMLIL